MTISINEKQWELPDSWNELSLEQALTIYGYISSDLPFLSEVEHLAAKKILITQYLMDIDDAFMLEWRKDAGPAFFDELKQLTDAVTEPYFEKTEAGTTIRLSLTKNPYPRLGNLWGPKDELKNISLIEMSTLFALLENFFTTRNEEIAYQIIATAYRPGKTPSDEEKRAAFHGDRRLPYSGHEDTVQERIEAVKTLHPQVINLLIFFFASSWHYIINRFPAVFTKSRKKSASKYGWASVILGLAGDLSKLAATKETNAIEALIYLDFILEEKNQN